MKSAAASLLLLASATALAGESVFPSKAQLRYRRMLDPTHISDRTKTLLRDRMKHHRRDTQDLVMAVATLQYAEVQQKSAALASAPRVDKSAVGATELDAAFFSLQDELRDRAGKLGEAAQRSDPKAMAQAMGHIMETCVTCHAVYVGPGKPADQEKK